MMMMGACPARIVSHLSLEKKSWPAAGDGDGDDDGGLMMMMRLGCQGQFTNCALVVPKLSCGLSPGDDDGDDDEDKDNDDDGDDDDDPEDDDDVPGSCARQLCVGCPAIVRWFNS